MKIFVSNKTKSKPEDRIGLRLVKAGDNINVMATDENGKLFVDGVLMGFSVVDGGLEAYTLAHVNPKIPLAGVGDKANQFERRIRVDDA